MTAYVHGYRPDIDGLRAVAVLAVLGFHGFPDRVPGGFAGVDVFFVISGFLISGIVFRALEAGRFSLADFYARRCRRIFPALVTVLVVCLLAGWALFLTDELVQLGKHTASGAGFVVNFTLASEAGYFDTAGELKPLLHLWSLGVEEQFYLIWPPLLALTYRWWRRPGTLLIVVGGLSLALNVERLSGIRAADAFYHPATRFWELLLGGALAYAAIRIQTSAPGGSTVGLRLSPRARELLSAAGLFTIAASVLWLDATTPFPRWAVVPTAGTALVIAAGPDAWLNRRVLASRGFVRVGLISYPLYLWHWPLLAFGRILHGRPLPAWVVVLLLAVAFGAAALTYNLIERPIRFAPRPRARLNVAALAISMVAVGGAGLLLGASAIPARLRSLDVISQAKGDWGFPPYKKREAHPTLDIRVRRLEGRSPRTILFIGDSNVAQLYPRIEALFRADDRRTVEIATAPGCSPIPEVRRTRGDCWGFSMGDAYEYALGPDIETVVIGSIWDYFETDAFAYQGLRPIPASKSAEVFGHLERRLRALVAAGKHVYVILPIPKGWQLDPRSMADLGARVSGVPSRVPPLPVREFNQRFQIVQRELRRVARRSGVTLLDPVPDMCTDVCRNVSADGRPIAKDEGHLRPFFVAEALHFLDPVFAGPDTAP